jgi:hypothetical protein
VNPADKRLTELLDKWLTSLELHLKYSALDEVSYWKVQPWVKHDRPSRWIIELARQKALQLKEQIDSRAAMGDAKFGDALELMAFLTNLVGSEHIERFIPLAEPQNEVDPRTVSQTQAMPAAPVEEPTRQSALVTQPRETIRARTDITREMPRPEPVEAAPPPRPSPPPTPAPAAAPAAAPMARASARDSGRHAHAHARGDSRKAARRDGKHAHGGAARPRTSPEKEKTVVADAIRLLGWGREWHELPDLIGRMADRPAAGEIRRILRDHKAAIEKQLKT